MGLRLGWTNLLAVISLCCCAQLVVINMSGVCVSVCVC